MADMIDTGRSPALHRRGTAFGAPDQTVFLKIDSQQRVLVAGRVGDETVHHENVVILVETALLLGRHRPDPGNGVRRQHVGLRHHLSRRVEDRLKIIVMDRGEEFGVRRFEGGNPFVKKRVVISVCPARFCRCYE